MLFIRSELWSVINGIDIAPPSNNPIGLTAWKLRVPKLSHRFYFIVVKTINFSSPTQSLLPKLFGTASNNFIKN